MYDTSLFDHIEIIIKNVIRIDINWLTQL